MSLIKSLKKTALVTGARKGLGFEVALQLATRNFEVIMADKSDQSDSRKRIISDSGNCDIHEYYLDLASLYSIRRFSEEIYRDFPSLDVLVNNAGVFCMKKQKTENCLDAVMQINHLGPFLLTHLMTDLLKRSKNGRIIFVSSNGSFFHRLLGPELLSKPNYFIPHFISGLVHYYNTKLCNIVASKYFAENLKKYNICCNSLHPHMMNTTFLTSNKNTFLQKVESRMTKSVIKYITRDVKYCADGVIFLASSDRVENITGKYFVNYQIHREPSVLEDRKFCREICEESERLVDLKH